MTERTGLTCHGQWWPTGVCLYCAPVLSPSTAEADENEPRKTRWGDVRVDELPGGGLVVHLDAGFDVESFRREWEQIARRAQ